MVKSAQYYLSVFTTTLHKGWREHLKEESKNRKVFLSDIKQSSSVSSCGYFSSHVVITLPWHLNFI